MPAIHASDTPGPVGTAPRESARATAVWLGLGLLLALAALLRLLGLDSQSLWVDEAFSYHYARPDSALTARYLFANLHGPLHAFVLHYWMQLAGTSELALRIPSVVASLAAVGVFWFFARRVCGRRVAWIGTLLLAVSPFHVWYAQEVRNYAFLILFAILAEWAFHRLITEGPRAGRLAAYGLALLAGFLSNLSMAFLLLVHVARLLLIVRGRMRGLRWRMVLVWALVGVCLIPWGIWFYRARIQESHLLRTDPVPQEERLRQETTDTPLGVPYSLYVMATGYSLGPARRELWTAGPFGALRPHWPKIALAALVFGYLWIAGLVRIWRKQRPLAWGLLLWQLLPILALLFLAQRNVKVINPRYLATIFPAFLLTLALGAQGTRRGRLAVALAVLLSLYAIGRSLTIEAYQKEDFRAATAYLQSELGPGDGLVRVAIDLPLKHYYLRPELRGQRPIAWEDLGNLVDWQGELYWKGRGPGSFTGEFLEHWGPELRLFAFFSREWAPDRNGRVEAALRRHGELIEERAWHGVRVLVLRRRAEERAS